MTVSQKRILNISWLKAIGRRLKANRNFKEQDRQLVCGKFGINYSVVPNSALDAHVVQSGIYNDWIADQNLIDIPNDACIFDIGANVGLLSLVFAKHYAPHGRVYAYEPDPIVFESLQRNLQVNSDIRNVHVNKIALQDDAECGSALFNIRRAIDGDKNENRGLSSLLNIPLHTVEQITVPVSTIDKEAQRLKIERLDLIKIDVEGFEYEVLRGGQDTLIKFKPVVLWERSKVIDNMTDRNNSMNSFDFLNELGYEQFGIVEDGPVKMNSSHDIEGDINILSLSRVSPHIHKIVS